MVEVVVGGIQGLAQLLGLRPILVTGDNARTAAAVAAEVGIDDVVAEALPQDKVEVVRSNQVRRAKLFYLRSLKGKAARLKEVDIVQEA